MKKSKISVFAIHRPNRAPNERYRWMQFSDTLNNHYEIDYLYLINQTEDKILFNTNNYFLKSIVLIKSFIKRFIQILSLKKTDILIIYRELHWLHCPLWMWILKKKSHRIIYDFDDAIFLPLPGLLNIIKQPHSKTIHFIRKSNTVIVGNNYLRNFSLQYNPNTVLIPTTVDTDYFIPLHHLRHFKNKIIIGWMGSHSTLPHLLSITPVLKKIKEEYPQVEYRIIGEKTWIQELAIYSESWEPEKEIENLNTFDIGIMPLPDDEWSKGKCGLKMLTYMACEIPCVVSNIGVNKEIIEKTNGGYLANNDEDWIRYLSELIEDKEKRINIGKQGRRGVEMHYSVKQWKNKFIDTILN